MSSSKREPFAPPLKVRGSIVEGQVKLQWKPIPRAKAYSIQWLNEDGNWATLWSFEGDEMNPAESGFIEYVDKYSGPMGPGGTYRITAHYNLSLKGKNVQSSPIVLEPNKPKRSELDELSRRIEGKTWSARVKSMVSRLKWSQRGWTTLLPGDSARCLGKRIQIQIHSQTLTDEILELLALILENLTGLSARAEKAFTDYGGHAALDDYDDIKWPSIVIDDTLRDWKRGGWLMVIEVKGSDYGWHIEFVRNRFKGISAGD